jgi:hypothetical protein
MGGLLSLFLDGLDWRINIFNLANIHANYVVMDKLLDFYYLTIELFIITKWKSIFAKRIGIGLYLLRIVGVVLLAITGKGYFLFIFPNIFENFFLFYLAVKHIRGREINLSAITLFSSVIILAVPKLIQEYFMHIRMLSDWRFITVPGTSFRYDNVYHQLLIGIILVGVVLVTQLKKKFTPG